MVVVDSVRTIDKHLLHTIAKLEKLKESKGDAFPPLVLVLNKAHSKTKN